MSEQFEETAFQTLWAEGIDPATAAEASRIPEPAPSQSVRLDWRFQLGLLIGTLIMLLWYARL
jgi:hypothetical protein